jgi:hypothetical protein
VAGMATNLALLLRYNSLSCVHSPISSGKLRILLDAIDNRSIPCKFPISGGTIVSLFRYSCNSRSFVKLENISGGTIVNLLLPTKYQVNHAETCTR